LTPRTAANHRCADSTRADSPATASGAPFVVELASGMKIRVATGDSQAGEAARSRSFQTGAHAAVVKTKIVEHRRPLDADW